MHQIHDENGNLIPHHGGDTCGHGEHHCGSCQQSEGCEHKDPKAEAKALLDYMVKHNLGHAAELDRLAANLDKLDMGDAAQQLRMAVTEYQKGNLRLNLAATLVNEHMKEA